MNIYFDTECLLSSLVTVISFYQNSEMAVSPTLATRMLAHVRVEATGLAIGSRPPLMSMTDLQRCESALLNAVNQRSTGNVSPLFTNRLGGAGSAAVTGACELRCGRLGGVRWDLAFSVAN